MPTSSSVSGTYACCGRTNHRPTVHATIVAVATARHRRPRPPRSATAPRRLGDTRLPRRPILAALAALALAAPAVADDASFNLVNRGKSAVRDLFVTPAGDANWGQNRLAGRPIPPGGSFLVKRRADGNC